MRFTQDGSRIHGTACFISETELVFHDVDVAVDYPDVSFVVLPLNTGSCCPNFAGKTWSGRFMSDGTLAGRFGGAVGDTRFTHASTSATHKVCDVARAGAR